MSGDPNKASIWSDADVYIGPLSAVNPIDENDEFGSEWQLVGLLDGDAGFEQERSQDNSDFYAWGQKLVRTSRRNFSITEKFTALEDNAVTAGLLWPGSTPGKLVIPKQYQFKIAFVTWDGDKKKILISAHHAEVDNVDTIKRSETELTKYAFTVKIYPTGDGQLYDVLPIGEAARTLVSISSTPATKTVKVGAIAAPLVITAQMSDGTTINVSKRAEYSSSAPSKATVDRGYIAGVAVGASNVLVSYGGQNATVAVTVEAA